MTGRFLLVVVMLAACGSGTVPPPERPKDPTTIVRTEVPAEIQRLLPKHGVYVVGGGETSPVFRIIVDTDTKTIQSGSAPAASALHGPLTEERTRELTPRNEEHLLKLCADAWGETAPATPPEPVDGYDEFFVIADGDRVFFLQGKGPITRPRAAKAVKALRAAGAFQ